MSTAFHQFVVMMVTCCNIIIAYKLATILVDFDDATSHCNSIYNSSLATIVTPKQNNIVSQLCSSNGVTNCWIGLKKETNNNKWYWMQNVTINFTKWFSLSSNNKNCVEIVVNTYNKIDSNSIYEHGEWNTISCDMYRYPICNDPPFISNDLSIYPSIESESHYPQIYKSNLNRNLLQIQNISCNWTYSGNDTCIINAPYDGQNDVECYNDYSNCEINLIRYGKRGRPFSELWSYFLTIHCPQNECVSCIISCSEHCQRIMIKGYNCQLVSIDTYKTGEFELTAFYAPGNGGLLEIIGTMRLSYVFSSIGTSDIIITIKDPFSSSRSTYHAYNDIDGRTITGDLNFSCIGDVSCDSTNIICGSIDTHCNINCSSSTSLSGTCVNLLVYAEGGTSIVNWYCDNSQSTACLRSRLECGNITHSIYSEWKYALNEWHYNTGDCVENWIPPLITCTIKSDDTCYIVKQYMDLSQTIQCADDLPNCLILLGDVDNTRMNWRKDLQSMINCPSSMECVSCIIQCLNRYSCWNITIKGYNCSLLQVHPRAIDQWWSTIYAPGNGGDLVLLTDIEQSDTSFNYAHIYSSPGTRNMIIYFDDEGVANTIHGEYVTDYLNLTCETDAACSWNEIICPNDASCNIDCRGHCTGSWVYATEGTHDVSWKCNNDIDDSYFLDGCNFAQLNCGKNFSQSSEWKYINGKWTLDNKTNGCVNIPTVEPSISPTTPTTYPTLSTAAPTRSPTTAPTESPTSAPTDDMIDSTELAGIIGVAVLVFILIIIVGVVIYYYRYYKSEKKSLYITNGLVLLIGISQYEDDEEQDSDYGEIGGDLRDLYGIDQDIRNMVKLFHKELNYDVYPSQYLDNINTGDLKQYWTEKELHDFLVDRANYLEKHVKKLYDGLIVIISCHGLPGYICTSDYKKFSKVAIHRIFSSEHPNSRGIPRIFLFDCCCGGNEQQRKRYSISVEEKQEAEEQKEQEKYSLNKPNVGIEMKESGKQISSTDIINVEEWMEGELNPDYRLAVIEAANHGFQSKLRNDIGSYVIYSFYEETMDILRNNKRTFIHETFDKIQDELQNEGKQHPTYEWNDNTRYIRFKKSNVGNKTMTHIGIEEIDMNESAELLEMTT